jgi:hypothetical protein
MPKGIDNLIELLVKSDLADLESSNIIECIQGLNVLLVRVFVPASDCWDSLNTGGGGVSIVRLYRSVPRRARPLAHPEVCLAKATTHLLAPVATSDDNQK